MLISIRVLGFREVSRVVDKAMAMDGKVLLGWEWEWEHRKTNFFGYKQKVNFI